MEVERIELQTGSGIDQLVLTNFEKLNEEYDYVYSCDVFMKSSEFSCSRNILFDKLDVTLESLKKMNQSIPGEAELKFRYEHQKLNFTMNKLGHVVVRGDFIQYGELTQSCKIAFRTDQTVLKYLIRDLSALL